MVGNNLVTEEWLKKLNKEFRESGVEQRRRPWEAVRRYSTEFNTSVSLFSDVANHIFEWFESNSKPGAHEIGSMFESVYFYDTQFWAISVPIIYGAVKLNALESLYQMSGEMKKELISDQKQAWDYVVYWADCVDYGLGFDDLKKTSGLDSYGMQLLKSGDQELRTSAAILNQSRPDSRAIMTCRMAVEIFFKAYIALKKGLSETEAKSIGHDLNKGLDKFIEVSGFKNWESIRNKLAQFPAINERYAEQDIPVDKLWDGFCVAQALGTVIIREYIERNTLEQVMPLNGQSNLP